jgi:hypothetical protein
MCAWLDYGDEAEGETLQDATAALLKKIKMLDNEGAKRSAEHAIEMQLNLYDESGYNEEHPVYVKSRARNAIAALRKDRSRGFYVRFEDGEEANCPIEDLEPAQADFAADLNKKCLGQGCCTGWFAASYLTPKNRKDIYERRFNFLDTIRSLFFVEAPFGLIRGYVHYVYHPGEFPSIFLLKNIVYGVCDLLSLMSCGNEKATCFSITPIELMMRMVKASPLEGIMVGPSGMMSHARDVAELMGTNALAAEKQSLMMHKAWLVLQREKVETAGREKRQDVQDILRSFTSAIRGFEERIAKVEDQMSQFNYSTGVSSLQLQR